MVLWPTLQFGLSVGTCVLKLAAANISIQKVTCVDRFIEDILIYLMWSIQLIHDKTSTMNVVTSTDYLQNMVLWPTLQFGLSVGACVLKLAASK